ncbi:hypothetical protein ACWCYY_31825 [Kitasatospora sp. NPDC001664]
MTTLPPPGTLTPDRTQGRIAAFDLVLAVLAQDGQAVTTVIRHLRTTADPGRYAYSCEQQLNELLADALTQVGLLSGGPATTARPHHLLAEHLARPGVLHHPPETTQAVAALAVGDLGPMRRLHGTPGLLARAVAIVGLGLAVRSPHWFRGLLRADREQLVLIPNGRNSEGP